MARVYPRLRFPESSYEIWKDAFLPYLAEIYVRGVRRWVEPPAAEPEPHRSLFEAFCSFVYQFSSKEIPPIFFQELEEAEGQGLREK